MTDPDTAERPATAELLAQAERPATADLPAPAELLVCVKCRRGREIPEDARRPGQRLFDELSARERPEGLRLTPVECLQNCDHGCTIALRGGARWSYVYGNVDEVAQPDLILDGAARYHATADGLIPWRERPEHFKRNCIARIPPPTDQTAPEADQT